MDIHEVPAYATLTRHPRRTLRFDVEIDKGFAIRDASPSRTLPLSIEMLCVASSQSRTSQFQIHHADARMQLGIAVGARTEYERSAETSNTQIETGKCSQNVLRTENVPRTL